MGNVCVCVCVVHAYIQTCTHFYVFKVEPKRLNAGFRVCMRERKLNMTSNVWPKHLEEWKLLQRD